MITISIGKHRGTLYNQNILNMIKIKTFELYFNPRADKKVAYGTFCFEPENKTEEVLGNLYIVGEINAFLSRRKNYRLLKNISKICHREYFSSPKKSPQENFKQTLEKINEFLLQNKEITQGQKSINIALLTINKEQLLNIARIGNIKCLLLREGQELEAIGNQESEGIEGKQLFQNIVTGTLLPKDKVLVITPFINEFFKKTGVLNQLSNLEPRKIKKFLKSQKKNFQNLKGAGIFVLLSEKKPNLYQQLFPKLPLFNISFIWMKPYDFLVSRLTKEGLKRNLIYILILLLLLLLGYLIFK